MAVLSLLLGLAITQDYSLITLRENHPIIFIFVLFLCLIDSRAIWLASCGIFGAKAFNTSYCKYSTVKLLRVVMAIGLLEGVSDIVYGGFVLKAISDLD